VDKTFDEVLDLLDMTIADERWRSRLGELTRLRECICDSFAGSKFYGSDTETLNKYLTDFAVLARKN
jgi:hypothetical protein